MTASDKLVPFGKYEGQPVTRLVEDSDYANWLLSQPWFRQKYDDLYHIVLNYGAEPQDTPEHNEMQAKFLGDDWRKALLKTARPDLTWEADKIPHKAENRGYDPRLEEYVKRIVTHEFATVDPGFEEGGWDVVYGIKTARVKLELQEWPECICECDHTDCPNRASCQGGDRTMACEHYNCDDNVDPAFTRPRKHCNDDCLWANEDTCGWLKHKSRRCYEGAGFWNVRVECKPTLGDDYPSVMRQVKRYDVETNDLIIVVTRDAEFERVTWDEVVQVFENSGVNLVRTRDVRKNLPND